MIISGLTSHLAHMKVLPTTVCNNAKLEIMFTYYLIGSESESDEEIDDPEENKTELENEESNQGKKLCAKLWLGRLPSKH